MRIVADTNAVISGLLWRGAPRLVLDAARNGRIDLFTSLPLLAELAEVLERPKLAKRLALAEVTPKTLVLGYSALAHLVIPQDIAPAVLADPDDDAVLACAVAAQAQAVVSGDHHLLDLRAFAGITILTARDLMSILDG